MSRSSAGDNSVWQLLLNGNIRPHNAKVPVASVEPTGYRLDASRYTDPETDDKRHLRIVGATVALSELAIVRGFGPFKRYWVDAPDEGIPLLSSSDFLQWNPNDVKLISKELTNHWRDLQVQIGWILVSCSGTIGNCGLVYRRWDGWAASQHCIRVQPLSTKYSGYLYAFLLSDYGQTQIMKQVSGSVVDHVYENDIAGLRVPQVPEDIKEHLCSLVDRVIALREEAWQLEKDAQSVLLSELGCPEKLPLPHYHAKAWATVSSGDLQLRLDAFPHVGYVTQVDSVLNNISCEYQVLRDLGFTFFRPGIFKANFVSKSVPFYTGVDLFKIHPKNEKWLATGMRRLDDLRVKEGQVLIQGDGQRYGLIGSPLIVDNSLDGVCVGTHLIRANAPSDLDAGYFAALLNTDLGRRIVLRWTHGSLIPSISVDYLSRMRIPWLSTAIRTSIGSLMLESVARRAYANRLEDEAVAVFSDAAFAPTHQLGGTLHV